LRPQRLDLLVEVLDLGDGARGRGLLQVEFGVGVGGAGVGAAAALIGAGGRSIGGAAQRSRSPCTTVSEARSCVISSCKVVLPVCSSESSWLSCKIFALRLCSAVSLPEISCDRKNCATMNTVSRKMIDRISVDSASTKPGQ